MHLKRYARDKLRSKILEPRTTTLPSVMVEVQDYNRINLFKSRSRVASNPMQGDKGSKIELNIEMKFYPSKNGVL